MAFLFHFWKMKVCYNGDFFPAHQPLLTIQNASYKWGDGVFETIKIKEGKLILQEYHFERLFESLRFLQIKTTEMLSAENLLQSILQLCKANDCAQNARIRLHVFRDENNDQ